MFTGAKYARSGDVNIAYQVVGSGSIDLVLVLGWVSHLAYVWELPALARFLNRLASFSRLILFDKRGCGMSDRVHPLPTLEQRMDDVRAVLDAVGSQKAALLGISEGGVMSALFAATYPERTAGLIIDGSYPSALRRPDYPWGVTEDQLEQRFSRVKDVWGKVAGMDRYAPSQVEKPEVANWWTTFMQMSASPGDAEDLLRMNNFIDIRDALPAIRVPTLIIHARGDRVAPFEAGRYFAEHIPNAKFLQLESDDHWPYFGDADQVIGEVQEFLTGVRSGPPPETMLATVLCTDVAQAGAHAIWLGDKRWNQLVDRHHSVVRKALSRYSGREIEAGEQGVTAVFDGTARAIRCAARSATSFCSTLFIDSPRFFVTASAPRSSPWWLTGTTVSRFRSGKLPFCMGSSATAATAAGKDDASTSREPVRTNTSACSAPVPSASTRDIWSSVASGE